MNALVAYLMAFSSVAYGLSQLASGTPTNHRVSNIVELARWSAVFSGRAYNVSKTLGILPKPAPPSRIPESDEEDAMLVNAGLDSYVEALVQDE